MRRLDETVEFYKTLFGSDQTEFRLIHPSTQKVMSFWGSFENQDDFKLLEQYNNEGYGVFVVINKVNDAAKQKVISKKGSSKDENVEAIRAVFVEIDSEEVMEGDNLERLENAVLTPSIIVQSSSVNRLHAYWLVADLPPDEFVTFQEQLIEYFQASTESKNLSRVMRLPGFFHTKREPVLSRLLSNEGHIYTRDELIQAFDIDPELKPQSDYDYKLPEDWQADSGFEKKLMEAAKTQAQRVERGGRHKKLFWFAFSCQDNRVDFDRAVKLINEFVNMLPKYDDPVTTKEALDVIKWTYKERHPGRPWNVIELRSQSLLHGFKRTDLGNAERFIAKYGDDVRFCPSIGWLVWDGQRWRPDELNSVVQLFKQMVRGMYKEALDIEDEATRAEAMKFIAGCESSTKINNALNLAKTERSIAVNVEAFDQDPLLLNCLNGTIELKTGKLREHRRSDLITKLAPVDYDASAQAPTWFKFLDEITRTDMPMIAPDLEGEGFDVDWSFIYYKQMAYGYSLTGLTDEQCVFIQYGTGANGKSTELEVLRAIMGDYSRQAEFDTFVQKRDSGVRNDIARLNGARFVTASEGEDGAALAESVIKRMTGGDMLTARFLNKEFFEFKPEFKVWLSTNHKPRVKGNDHGIWRRIKLLPYEVTIPKEKRDKQLVKKLLAELPGVLAWAVVGAVSYLASRALPEVKAISAATTSYQDDMDTLGVFLDEYFQHGPAFGDYSVTRKDLRFLYVHYCRENGEFTMSQKALINELSKRGFPQTANQGIRGFKGLKVNKDAEAVLNPSSITFRNSYGN